MRYYKKRDKWNSTLTNKLNHIISQNQSLRLANDELKIRVSDLSERVEVLEDMLQGYSEGE